MGVPGAMIDIDVMRAPTLRAHRLTKWQLLSTRSARLNGQY